MSTNSIHLTEAIAYLGGISSTARHLGVSRQVVFNWTKRGIPADKVLILCDKVADKVSPAELRPDVFALKHHAGQER